MRLQWCQARQKHLKCSLHNHHSGMFWFRLQPNISCLAFTKWPVDRNDSTNLTSESIYLKTSGYLEGIDDQVPGLQLSLQDAEKHQQIWFGQTLHIQVGLQGHMKGERTELRCCHSNYRKGVLCFDLPPCSSTSRIQWQSAVWLRTCDVVSLKFLCTLISQLCSLHPPPPHTSPMVATSQTSNCTPGKWTHAAFPLKRDQSRCCFHAALHLSDVWELACYTTEHQHNSSLSPHQFSAFKHNNRSLKCSPELKSTLKCPASPSTIFHIMKSFCRWGLNSRLHNEM